MPTTFANIVLPSQVNEGRYEASMNPVCSVWEARARLSPLANVLCLWKRRFAPPDLQCTIVEAFLAHGASAQAPLMFMLLSRTMSPLEMLTGPIHATLSIVITLLPHGARSAPGLSGRAVARQCLLDELLLPYAKCLNW